MSAVLVQGLLLRRTRRVLRRTRRNSSKQKSENTIPL